MYTYHYFITSSYPLECLIVYVCMHVYTDIEQFLVLEDHMCSVCSHHIKRTCVASEQQFPLRLSVCITLISNTFAILAIFMCDSWNGFMCHLLITSS